VDDARNIGYTTTLYGRKRSIPELKSSNFNIRQGAEIMALITPIQGTAADLIKLAMIRVDQALSKAYPEAKLILQVHDELIVECPEDIAEDVANLMSTQMENVAMLDVPLLAEAKWGNSWYEAK
jgi:DNA polymerase-1